MNSPKWLGRMAEAYNSRVLRERILMAATGLVVVMFLAWQLLLGPVLQRHQALAHSMAQKTSQVASLRDQIQALDRRLQQDPNIRLQADRHRLQQQRDTLQNQLEQGMQNLVSPEAMVSLLKQMLVAQKGVSLESIKHLAPRPVQLPNADSKPGDNTRAAEDTPAKKAGVAAGVSQPQLYAHDVELVVTGSFFDLLGYLEQLESLDQKFGWRLMDYSVKTYPKAQMRLQVETLSLRKEWLGV